MLKTLGQHSSSISRYISSAASASIIFISISLYGAACAAPVAVLVGGGGDGHFPAPNDDEIAIVLRIVLHPLVKVHLMARENPSKPANVKESVLLQELVRFRVERPGLTQTLILAVYVHFSDLPVVAIKGGAQAPPMGGGSTFPGR